MPARLIDLHCDWPLQYAGETTDFDARFYPGVGARLGQVEGYLQGTSASVFACYRDAGDWAGCADPWLALGSLFARIEAEFPGRLLIGPDDASRWRDDSEGLCWGAIGVEGFDALIRTPADLDRLARLFEHGVRVFQPVYTAASLLAGSASPGDDRGLTDLGRAFLDLLAGLATDDGPRPILDLAHLNPRSASDVLDWFEQDGARSKRLIPVYSHGALSQDGFDSPRFITAENLGRLRALGGVMGFTASPGFYPTADALKASIETAASLPFLGRFGYEGLAIGTDFLGVDKTLAGLGNVAGVVAWLESTFDRETASSLVSGNARVLLSLATGAGPFL